MMPKAFSRALLREGKEVQSTLNVATLDGITIFNAIMHARCLVGMSVFSNLVKLEEVSCSTFLDYICLEPDVAKMMVTCLAIGHNTEVMTAGGSFRWKFRDWWVPCRIRTELQSPIIPFVEVTLYRIVCYARTWPT